MAIRIHPTGAITMTVPIPGASGVLSDGDYGDIVVSGGGTVMTVDTTVINQNITTSGSPEFVDLSLNDTTSIYRTTLRSTSSGPFSADRVLTIDLVNTARTLKITGNPTIADWFDQGVKVAGTPQFAKVGIGAAAHATAILRVDDTVAAPSTSAATGLVNCYGGDGNYCGDPNAWLRIHASGTTYKIPLYV